MITQFTVTQASWCECRRGVDLDSRVRRASRHTRRDRIESATPVARLPAQTPDADPGCRLGSSLTDRSDVTRWQGHDDTPANQVVQRLWRSTGLQCSQRRAVDENVVRQILPARAVFVFVVD